MGEAYQGEPAGEAEEGLAWVWRDGRLRREVPPVEPAVEDGPGLWKGIPLPGEPGNVVTVNPPVACSMCELARQLGYLQGEPHMHGHLLYDGGRELF